MVPFGVGWMGRAERAQPATPSRRPEGPGGDLWTTTRGRIEAPHARAAPVLEGIAEPGHRSDPMPAHDLPRREHLWEQFGRVWGWPPADLTLEQDLIDLGWHQKEFQLRSPFDNAVMSPDDSRVLGCVHVDPPEKAGYDAEVWRWVRVSELGTGLDAEPYATARRWVEERWPFRRVAYPGRELPLDRYEALPDR